VTRHRVVIDTRTVVARASGIGNYVSALVRHMVPLADDLHFLLLRHPQSEGWLFEHPRVDELRFRGETKSLSTIAMGRLLRFDEQDLYHGPADIVPPGISCPSVVTLHDLMWVEKPHLAASFGPARWFKGAFYRHYFRRSVADARRVIAISQSTSDAIARVWPEHASKVSVVHHGVDHERYRPSEVGPRQSLNEIVPPGSPYALIIGQGSPYKNHLGMIRAFLEATEDHPEHKLVLVRRFSRVDVQMRRLLARPDVRRRVIALPFVRDEQLLTLLGHARMLLFVSHYEGFGMPPLESFAMGTPVLASTAPAVAEITGNAALHADPNDHRDMVRKMRTLLRDDELCRDLSERGRARAAEFTWTQCAKQTLRVYRSALRSPR